MARMSYRPLGCGATSKVRNPTNASKLPTEVGDYYWTEYDSVVLVYKKKGSKHLYVTPPIPGSPEVRITRFIAGEFKQVRISPILNPVSTLIQKAE